MDVSLTPEQARYVDAQIRNGRYATADDVVHAGLRLLQEAEERRQRALDDLRREVQVGLDQADRGQVSPFTEATLAEAKARGAERLAAGRRPESR